MRNPLFDDRDIIQSDNHATRIPVVLCLDVSGSMQTNGGFDALNLGVKAFFDACKNDTVNRFGFDVEIITFGSLGANVVQGFRTVWDQDSVPTFKFMQASAGQGQGTPLAKAINLSLDNLEKHKSECKAKSIAYYPPFLVAITDGHSYKENKANIKKCQQRAVEMQRKRKLKMLAIGVGDLNFSELANFVVDKKILLAKDFSAFDLAFELMSQTMSSSSTNSGHKDTNEVSLVSDIVEALNDEGEYSMRIEDFGRDD